MRQNQSDTSSDEPMMDINSCRVLVESMGWLNAWLQEVSASPVSFAKLQGWEPESHLRNRSPQFSKYMGRQPMQQKTTLEEEIEGLRKEAASSLHSSENDEINFMTSRLCLLVDDGLPLTKMQELRAELAAIIKAKPHSHI